jgi:DNA-binding NarL/FixJ family response regulator
MTIQIVIVDDHDGMRKSLANYLSLMKDIEIIAETGDCYDALRICSAKDPDVVLVDVRMKEMSGSELTRRLREAGNDAGIVGLSMYRREEMMDLMMDAGADGYVDKMAAPAELLSLVRETADKARERKKSRAAGGTGQS